MMVVLLKRKMLLMDKLDRINGLLKKFGSELENDDAYSLIMHKKLLTVKEQITRELERIEKRMEV